MEMEMFPTEGQLWLGLQGIIPGVTFPALSLILWGTFQKFLHLAAQEAPRVSLGQGLCTVTHAVINSAQVTQFLWILGSTRLPTRGNVHQELFQQHLQPHLEVLQKREQLLLENVV